MVAETWPWPARHGQLIIFFTNFTNPPNIDNSFVFLCFFGFIVFNVDLIVFLVVDTPSNLAASCEQTSKLWYRPKMTRDDIMAALCRQPVGSFIIRDSTSYPGYYGLAIKTDMSGMDCIFNFRRKI